jgi:L-asparaginase
MKQKEPIRIFVTGGTFDKEYNEHDGSLFFKETHLPEMLSLGRSNMVVEVEVLMMVDSLDMSQEQRKLIVGKCRQAGERRILITHGTDTMVETAAMVPYKFGSSDGLFNLGSALAFAQALPPGVYIAMNGRYFRWDRVRKNRESGMFEET